MVRWRPGGVDQLHAVFPNGFAGRLWLRALAGIAPQPESTVPGAPGDAGRITRVFADRAARGGVEIGKRGRSLGPNSRAAGRHYRRPVSVAFGHHTAAATLVLSGASGRIAVALVCAVEPGLVPGAVQLPLRSRTVSAASYADVDMVGLLRNLR